MSEATLEYRLTAIEKRVAENEEKNTNAHKEFYKDLGELRQFEAVTNDRYATLNVNISTIMVDVQTLKERPTKKWDSLTTVIITATVTAIITSIIASLW